jgi:hypothetical protein
VLGLLPYLLHRGWLHSGISSGVDEMFIPPRLGPQSLVCKSRLHLGEMRLRFGQEKLLLARTIPAMLFSIYQERYIQNPLLTAVTSIYENNEIKVTLAATLTQT